MQRPSVVTIRHVVTVIVWMAAVSAAQGAGLKEFTATWVMRLGERNLFVLTLTPGGDGVQGSFERPAKLTAVNSIFSGMGGGVRQDKVARGHLEHSVLHLTIQNANDPKDQDSYAMTVKGNHAELTPENLPPGMVLESYAFERAAAGAAVATDWEPNRAYAPGDSDVPSTEMKAIYDEDQRVRMAKTIDWNAVNKSDAERREQTRNLLAVGALHTGKDYEEAAFVFQHGDSASDYLLAHTVAMVAVTKGDSAAIWIAAATLDRYLGYIGQKQIFGTQFMSDPKGNWTQEPYNTDLVSDALRRQLGVPPRAVQAQQLNAYQNQH